MDLERRIERLEAANKRLKFALTVILVVAGTVALTAALSAKPETVRASRFELVDGDGNVLGAWYVDGPRGSQLDLRDSKGKNRVELWAKVGTGAILLKDHAAKTRATLTVPSSPDEPGGGLIEIEDKRGKKVFVKDANE